MIEMTLDKLPRKVLARIDLQTAFMVSQCVLVAENIGLFRILEDKSLTLSVIRRKTGIRSWKLESFLAVLGVLGLVVRRGDTYNNSRLASKYYVKERPIEWTRFYSETCFLDYADYSVLKETLLTGKSNIELLGIKREGYVEYMRRDKHAAHDFTRMLYHDHLRDAELLSKNLDLTGYNNILDLGGGSGVMSIALVRKYKFVKACVLDIEPVIKVTKKIIKEHGLTKRITTLAGDMHKHIPEGYDVIMLCDADSSKDTLKNVYQSLDTGGMVVIVDNFSSEDLTKPLFRLLWQLRSNSPWLMTLKQAKEQLQEAGFRSIRQKKLYGCTWMLTGLKR
ncbi:MAG: methyltransferase domain-containing protein [candidate division Zixibacteria bacterium]|nr:methyltransferase domain-containing protein [candidate division Zixibacteria bacterium]